MSTADDMFILALSCGRCSIRHPTMTPEQQSLVDAISAVLQGDPRIEAAWLAGSLGRNAGDEFSDVDVVVLCPDGTANEIAAKPGLLNFAKPVLINTLFGGRIVNVITPDWQRFDLVFAEASDLSRYNANDLKQLFNRTGREPPRTAPVSRPSTAEGLAKLVQEFYRVMTLAPLGIGRKEYIVALSGIELLRRMTVDLMLEENGVGQNQRGGALVLSNAVLFQHQIDSHSSQQFDAAQCDDVLFSSDAKRRESHDAIEFLDELRQAFRCRRAGYRSGARRLPSRVIEELLEIIRIIARQIARFREDQVEALPVRRDHIHDASAEKRVDEHGLCKVKQSRFGCDFICCAIRTKDDDIDIAKFIPGVSAETSREPRRFDPRIALQHRGNRVDQALLFGCHRRVPYRTAPAGKGQNTHV